MKRRDHGVEGQAARSARVSPSQQTLVREDLLDDGLIPNRRDVLELAAKLSAVSYGSWPIAVGHVAALEQTFRAARVGSNRQVPAVPR